MLFLLKSTEANWGPKRRHGRGGETKEVEPSGTEGGAVSGGAQDADAAADQKQSGETVEPAAKRAKN